LHKHIKSAHQLDDVPGWVNCPNCQTKVTAAGLQLHLGHRVCAPQEDQIPVPAPERLPVNLDNNIQNQLPQVVNMQPRDQIRAVANQQAADELLANIHVQGIFP
jgi:acetyl-CoA carboxylase beta subunit